MSRVQKINFAQFYEVEIQKEYSGNFIKIAYSGNSMDKPTPPPPKSKWVRDAPACAHLFRHMLEIPRPCT